MESKKVAELIIETQKRANANLTRYQNGEFQNDDRKFYLNIHDELLIQIKGMYKVADAFGVKDEVEKIVGEDYINYLLSPYEGPYEGN